jgi:hypothetical protein
MNMDKESEMVFSSEIEADGHCETPDAVPLDPEGDVILVVNDPARNVGSSFLVSSRVLSLASPVFSKMFGPDFAEGIQVRRGNRPYINLEENDPEAMELILRILHYQCADISFSMDPKSLAVLAIHCDKYDCIRALRPWAAHWCSRSVDISAPEDFGYMLLAAYMLRLPSFCSIATDAAKQLTPDFVSVWEEHETLGLLPEAVTGLSALTEHEL